MFAGHLNFLTVVYRFFVVLINQELINLKYLHCRDSVNNLLNVFFNLNYLENTLLYSTF